MQIPAGSRISDLCSFCYEHSIHQPCAELDAWVEAQACEAADVTKWDVVDLRAHLIDDLGVDADDVARKADNQLLALYHLTIAEGA